MALQFCREWTPLPKFPRFHINNMKSLSRCLSSLCLMICLKTMSYVGKSLWEREGRMLFEMISAVSPDQLDTLICEGELNMWALRVVCPGVRSGDDLFIAWSIVLNSLARPARLGDYVPQVFLWQSWEPQGLLFSELILYSTSTSSFFLKHILYVIYSNINNFDILILLNGMEYYDW